MTNGAAPAKSYTIVFSGPIYQNATKLLRNGVCAAVNNGITDLTILFSSEGGSIDDGFSLYGLLRSLPLDLTIHNVGFVCSVANAVFLAGKTRLASPHSIFIFHDMQWRYTEAQTLKSVTMTEHAMVLENSRLRLQSLFNHHAKPNDPLFNGANFFKEPTIHDANTAKTAGIVHDIKDAAVPAGTQMMNVDWA